MADLLVEPMERELAVELANLREVLMAEE